MKKTEDRPALSAFQRTVLGFFLVILVIFMSGTYAFMSTTTTTTPTPAPIIIHTPTPSSEVSPTPTPA